MSPTEARIAADLFAGCSLADLSTSHGTAWHTTRTHVKRIFAKMKVQGRVEFLRTVFWGSTGLARLVRDPAPPPLLRGPRPR